MDKFCFSCAAPPAMPDFKGPAENHCKYCTDDQGRVKSRAEVQAGVAQWFMMWQPGLDEQTAAQRADIYLRAMPEWVE